MSAQGGDQGYLSGNWPYRLGREVFASLGRGPDKIWSEGDALSYALSASGLGHFRVGLSTGQFWASEGCRVHLELGPGEEVTSLEQMRTFVHPDDVSTWEKTIDLAVAGTTEWQLEHRVITRTGKIRWAMVRARVCRCAKGNVAIAGIFIDITAQKTAEAERERLITELAAERARLRALIEHMPAGVVMSDATTGQVVLTNQNIERIFQLPDLQLPVSSDELFATLPARHPDGRLAEPDERPMIRGLRGESVEGEDFLFELPDGSESWVRLAAAPILDNGGAITGSVVIACDIDLEKRAEEALRKSESRHRQLFESPVLGIFHARTDGRITGTNDTFLQMTGYTHEDVDAGRLSWMAMTPPEYLAGNDRRINELLTTGSLQVNEKAYIRKNGTIVPVVIGGAMLAGSTEEFFCFILDVSDRKRAERERETLMRSLERSEERYRLAVQATEDAIYDADLRTRRMSAQSLDGDRNITTSDAWVALIHPDDREGVQARLFEAIASGERQWQAEYRMRRADGAWAVVSDRGQFVNDEDGIPARMVGAVQDITARRRQEEFERQLIGIVSHDLKNPLNTILLAADSLARNNGVATPSRTNAMRIRTAAERATRMIRDLLDFTRARLGAGIPIDRRTVGLEPIFQNLIDDVRAGNPERPIVLQSSGNCCGAFDADRLLQVLTNLIDNALKYSPAHSQIRVNLRGERDEVILVVHNEGPPIPAALLPRIFEPLQRGDTAFDPTGRSVGLGLYIVQQLVEAHGGDVEVRSSEREGTQFRVRLPRAERSRAA